MVVRESELPEDLRIEAVAIVTPNHLHAAPAITAMEAGLDVIIEKPLRFFCSVAESTGSQRLQTCI